MPRGIETIDSSLSQDPACASLLPKNETDERFNNNLFGQFKGFTLSALPSAPPILDAEPTKPAPPPPTVPTVAIKTNIKPLQRNNTLLRNTFLNSPPISHQQLHQNAAPALPPLNPGCTARPLISSPVLAATTCTSMELIAAKVPTRPAPDIPGRPIVEPPAISHPTNTKPQRPTSTPLVNVVITSEIERKPQEKSATSTLNRLASMLRPGSGIMRSLSQPQSIKDEKNTNSLPRSQHQKANKVIDKEILRNLEISNPIPQKEIDIATQALPVIKSSDSQEKRAVVMRAQSMRDPKITARPAIHTFGSMRQANPAKRPTSIPASARPTSPPPGPPVTAPAVDKNSENLNKIPGLPGYQNPPAKIATKPVDNAYDDCMNLVPESALTKIMEESPSNDNIYAVIEESIPEKNRKKVEQRAAAIVNEYKSPKPIDNPTNVSRGNSSDTMGLLSEIVSEISNRNFDSIYSTSTLARKKREKEEADKQLENLGSNSSIGTYANSSNHYKSPGSVYSNTASGKFNSASSTTSSGYLNPSALNVPQRAKENFEKSETPTSLCPTKPVDENKLSSLHSNNPNINDAMSKALGMAPPETVAPAKPIVSALRPNLSLSSTVKKDDKKEDKAPAKPPLNRTKTPPNLTKATSKTTGETEIKPARQNSDTSLKSGKSDSNQSSKTSRQGSDASLKSNKVLSPTRSNGNLNKIDSKRDSVGSLTGVKLTTPTKDSSGKLSNSPDLVSSCANVSPKTSPDVTLGSNAKTSAGVTKSTSSITQKTPTLSRGPSKTPSMPPKPSSIMTKAASFAERKKSPTSAGPTIPITSVTKSLSLSAKDSKPAAATSTKIGTKSDAKCAETKANTVQKAAGSKSNVASLQQKFEANKLTNPSTRTVSSVNKKTNIGKTLENFTTKK